MDIVIDAFGEGRTARVKEETWGHLRPTPKTRYQGYVIFTLTVYGEYTVIDYNFDGLEDSPWYCDDVNDWISKRKTEYGEIYRFDGTYEKFKNDNYRFSGKVKTIYKPVQ